MINASSAHNTTLAQIRAIDTKTFELLPTKDSLMKWKIFGQMNLDFEMSFVRVIKHLLKYKNWDFNK